MRSTGFHGVLNNLFTFMEAHTNMAEQSHPPQTLQQQLLVNGGDTPESYIYKGGYGAGDSNSNPLPLAEIPVVDLSQLSPSPGGEAPLEELRLALSSWGCFQVCYFH